MPSTRNGKGRLECCEDIQELVSDVLNIRSFLTLEEESRIHRRFRGSSWHPNYQVLWSGMYREQAQSWADGRSMQTLTTAMGALMDPRVPSCPKNGKSDKAWSKYIHGASAVFAWHIAVEDVVTVLCPPPLQRFHPSGLSHYQAVEEPILRAAIANGSSLRIELVHPLVKGAEDFRYEMWPVDKVERWIEAFETAICHKCVWRMVKGDSPQIATKKAAQIQSALAKATAKATEQIKITTAVRTGCQPVSAKKSKKKKKKTKSQMASPRCETPVSITSTSSSATQSKSAPHNASSPVGPEKKPAAKTARSLYETSSPQVEKAMKEARKQAIAAAMKDREDPRSNQPHRAAKSKKTPRNASPPAGQKKNGPTAKTTLLLEGTILHGKAKKKAKNEAQKAQKAAAKQGQELTSQQALRAATSKTTQSTKVTRDTSKAAGTPDKVGRKRKTKTSQKRPSKEERQALRAAVAEYGNQLASSTCIVQSKETQRDPSQSKQDILQRDVVYETWLDY